jgi:SAM-dependent methyltransferase
LDTQASFLFNPDYSMKDHNDYLSINKDNWNKRTTLHVKSDFYNYDGFVDGDTSLNPIELGLLPNVKGKSMLHLQCHFGQDTISWQRLGATVTGVDLSDNAIKEARLLNDKCSTDANFICSDVFSLPDIHDSKYDIVFTSYGTIGWLPNLDRWAEVVSHHLKPGGTFLIVDFHPMIWMYDDDLTKITYSYFNKEAIVEEEQGSYADKNSSDVLTSVGWNHSISDLINSLIKYGLTIEQFDEYDYSPYQVFPGMVEAKPKQFVVEKWAGKVPLLYALKATQQ